MLLHNEPNKKTKAGTWAWVWVYGYGYEVDWNESKYNEKSGKSSHEKQWKHFICNIYSHARTKNSESTYG